MQSFLVDCLTLKTKVMFALISSLDLQLARHWPSLKLFDLPRCVRHKTVYGSGWHSVAVLQEWIATPQPLPLPQPVTLLKSGKGCVFVGCVTFILCVWEGKRSELLHLPARVRIFSWGRWFLWNSWSAFGKTITVVCDTVKSSRCVLDMLHPTWRRFVHSESGHTPQKTVLLNWEYVSLLRVKKDFDFVI
jgi:hypothetical protein